MAVRRTPKSRTIKASEFKAKCLALMDEVERRGESVMITRNGKPIAELSPYKQHKRRKRKLFGVLKDACSLPTTSFRRSESPINRSIELPDRDFRVDRN